MGNLQIWNDVALLKSWWALVSKKDRLWIKWVNAYYIKRADIMQFRLSSTASWMLARIIDSRSLVSDMNQLSSLCFNGEFSIKKPILRGLLLSLSLPGGC